MNRLQQDAADTLVWHERQERHKRGYGPRPSEPLTGTWSPPALTEQQQREFDEYSRVNSLPF